MEDIAHDGVRPAAGSLSDQDLLLSGRRKKEQEEQEEQEEHEKQEGLEEQEQKEQQDAEEEVEEAEEEEEEEEEEFQKLSAAVQQTAVQLEEGADSFRNRSKIELEFRLQGAEVEEAELHGSVSGIPVSTELSQVLGPGSRIRAPSPDRQERDEAEEAEPGMDASVDKPKAKPAKQSKSQKKAKRTPPVMPVPVKTRVELLPPVRLPALTRRNRKNTVAKLKSASLLI